MVIIDKYKKDFEDLSIFTTEEAFEAELIKNAIKQEFGKEMPGLVFEVRKRLIQQNFIKQN